MPKIDTIILRCMSPAAQMDFYCEVLGMTAFGDGSIGYPGPNAHLRFSQASKPYQDSPSNLYWKIAIAVPNIELAFHQLSSQGVAVSTPYQFQDIGYLAHFTDPEGFTIELIEHTFKGKRIGTIFDTSCLGGGPHLNLLTLRAENIQVVDSALTALGMKPLSIQRVEPDRFSLYFYAFRDDEPPFPDLTSVEIRPWLYQRPYTVLEIQKNHKPVAISNANFDEAGYAEVTISGANDLDLTMTTVNCLKALHLKKL